MIFPTRGSIYLVNLDPTIGPEVRKTRPAVIIQNNIGNKYSPLTVIITITGGGKSSYPFEVKIEAPEGGLKSDSLAQANQIRAIDKRRLVKYLGKLKSETMKKVNSTILISLGLVDL